MWSLRLVPEPRCRCGSSSPAQGQTHQLPARPTVCGHVCVCAHVVCVCMLCVVSCPQSAGGTTLLWWNPRTQVTGGTLSEGAPSTSGSLVAWRVLAPGGPILTRALPAVLGGPRILCPSSASKKESMDGRWCLARWRGKGSPRTDSHVGRGSPPEFLSLQLTVDPGALMSPLTGHSFLRLVTRVTPGFKGQTSPGTVSSLPLLFSCPSGPSSSSERGFLSVCG